MVAQPPFSMRARRSQDEETLLNATSFAAESVCCWNFSTQIGASAATTAVSARWLAIFSAVLPSVHPSDENPTTANATAPTTAPHTAGFTPGWIFISSPWLWEKRTPPVSTEESYRAASLRMLDSETTQSTLALLDCRILATVLLTRRRGAAYANAAGRPIAL